MQAGRAKRKEPRHQAWSHLDAEPEDERDSWITTYADMLTLLLTMFVLLMAYATFEPNRYERSPALLEGPESGTMVEGGADASGAPEPDLGMGMGGSEMTVGERARLFKRAIESSSLGDKVEVETVDEGIELQIRDRILFPRGGDRISEAGYAVLDDIATLLRRTEAEIAIEGHTDSLPISTLRFPSNWELSAARAARVLRYLAARGIDTGRMRAVGYADTRPVAGNDTPEGRAANRRVTIRLEMKE